MLVLTLQQKRHLKEQAQREEIFIDPHNLHDAPITRDNVGNLPGGLDAAQNAQPNLEMPSPFQVQMMQIMQAMIT